MLTQTVVVFLSNDVTDEERLLTHNVLSDRGFEVFADRPLGRLERDLKPNGITQDGHLLIAYNPLISNDGLRNTALFPQFEVEKAAHLLASVIPEAKHRLRVTQDATLANEFIHRLLDESEIAELSAAIATSQAEMSSDLTVLKDLSRYKFRAKVELVRWQDGVAIQKTFRASARDAMARELQFHDEIAPLSPVPVRVLDRSGNAIVYEYIDDSFKDRRVFGSRLFSLLNLANTRALADFVRLVLENGWDPIDLTPGGNILIDRSSGELRAIDFEFAHRRDRAIGVDEAYFLKGVPPDADFAHPLNNDGTVDPYERRWRRFTGLSLASFLEDPAWLQRIKRVFVHPFWLVGYVVREVRQRTTSSKARDEALRSVVWRRLPASGK